MHLFGPLDAQGPSWSTPGVVLDVFGGTPEPLLGSPGLLLVAFGGALGVSGGAFWIIFLNRRGLRSENLVF